ncbi:MAG: hypothetical protein ACP5N2_01300 [Candidatus Nanoarchaeia archaeon]
MEMFQELREKSVKNVLVADHMLGVSYPLLNDPKILVSVANNMLLAVDHALTAVLEHEKLFKRIQNYPDTVDGKFAVVKQRALKGSDLKNYAVIAALIEIVGTHKASPVEFPRQDKYVLCSDTYELRTLTAKELKEHLIKVRGIVDQLYEMTRKNDGIFR